jgi:hypothetical protein
MEVADVGRDGPSTLGELQLGLERRQAGDENVSSTRPAALRARPLAPSPNPTGPTVDPREAGRGLPQATPLRLAAQGPGRGPKIVTPRAGSSPAASERTCSVKILVLPRSLRLSQEAWEVSNQRYLKQFRDSSVFPPHPQIPPLPPEGGTGRMEAGRRRTGPDRRKRSGAESQRKAELNASGLAPKGRIRVTGYRNVRCLCAFLSPPPGLPGLHPTHSAQDCPNAWRPSGFALLNNGNSVTPKREGSGTATPSSSAPDPGVFVISGVGDTSQKALYTNVDDSPGSSTAPTWGPT